MYKMYIAAEDSVFLRKQGWQAARRGKSHWEGTQEVDDNNTYVECDLYTDKKEYVSLLKGKKGKSLYGDICRRRFHYFVKHVHTQQISI